MDRIQIAMTNVPRMLRELLERLVDAQPDMEVVRDVAVPPGAGPAARRVPPVDVVLVATESEELPAEYVSLLYAWPRARVIAITESSRGAAMFELRPHRTPLGNASPDALLAAIRSSVTRRWVT